jgi:hypothetical protein
MGIARQKSKKFKLLRYFSMTSLVTFAAVTVLLGLFYGQVARNNLINLGEQNNVALTQAFSNSIWPEFAPFLTLISGLPWSKSRYTTSKD